MNSFQSLLARLCVTLGVAGCAAPSASVSSRPATARLAVVNMTGDAWRVSLRAGEGEGGKNVELPPHGSVQLECAAGRYVLEQARLAPDGTPMGGRSFPMELGEGQSYRWPIATLRVTEAEEAGAEPARR